MSGTFARGKPPPYSRQIDPASDLVMIFGGSKAWRLAQGEGSAKEFSLAFPKGADPSVYRWPVIDRQVVVWPHDEDMRVIGLLVVELLRQGARDVFVRSGDDTVHYERPA